MMGSNSELKKVANALNNLGIRTQECAETGGFLKGVRIVDGGILYQPDAKPSNILHEAGHLACFPPAYRPYAQDALTGIFRMLGEAMSERMEASGNADDPLIRAILQCSDPEATAWAFAFGRSIGLDPEIIILPDEYDGAGEFVRRQLCHKSYVGINGLRAAGMLSSVRDYPRLTKWLQDAV